MRPTPPPVQPEEPVIVYSRTFNTAGPDRLEPSARVARMLELLRAGVGPSKIARELGVKRQTVAAARERWLRNPNAGERRDRCSTCGQLGHHANRCHKRRAPTFLAHRRAG